MTTSIRKLARILILTFALIGATLGYWGLVVRPTLLAREDNPRLVLDEQQIQRGLILDRDGKVLAQSNLDAQSGLIERVYPSPSAAPVIGYYSIRHGVGGIEAQYDAILRGTFGVTPMQQLMRDTLHQPQIGGDVQLTIDAELQQQVDGLLADHTGAVVLISAPHGEILAMASHPTYDPNQLEQNWDDLFDDPSAPLLNRATQGLYQPGTALQSVVLGAALDSGILLTEHPWQDLLYVMIDGSMLPCADTPHVNIDDLGEAFVWGCPAPFQGLATLIGPRRLDAIIGSFGLLEAPMLELPTEASDTIPPPALDNLALTAIGQSKLTVSPLQMAQIAAGFANHGEIPALQIVHAMRPAGSEWTPIRASGMPRGTISRTSADVIAQLMQQSVERGGAQAANLPDQRIYGHAGLAVAGPRGTLDAWFIGFTYSPTSGQAIAVAVLLEDQADARVAAQIGAQALQSALDDLP